MNTLGPVKMGAHPVLVKPQQRSIQQCGWSNEVTLSRTSSSKSMSARAYLADWGIRIKDRVFQQETTLRYYQANSSAQLSLPFAKERSVA